MRHRDPVPDLSSPASVPQHADNIAAAALRCDVHCIQWSPTNGALACGGADGRAHLLKPSGELLGRIPDASPEASADLYARDTLSSGATSLSSVAPPIRALAFSKGSRYLASAGAAAEVTIWDLKRKSKLKSLVGHADAVAAVAYSPGDQHLASAGREGRVILHSPVSGLVVGEMQAPGAATPSGVSGVAGISALHYSPHRRQMLASASADGAVRVWDTGVRRLASTLSTLSTDAAPSAVNDARFSPAAPNVLAAACADGRLVLMDADAPAGSNRHALGSIAVGAGATSVAWRGDGNALAVGASDGRVVWLDPRMIGKSSGDNSRSVVFVTAAHVGSGGVTSVRWQHAADGSAAASTAAEATTPTPMKTTRPHDSNGLTPLGAPGDSRATPPGGPLFAVDANAAERPERSGSALDGSALDAKERAARRAAELEEEARKRVERLLSARGTGTPEAAAAAARPTRGGAPTPVPKTLSLSQRLGTGTGTAGTAGSVPDLDVPGTLALAEAIAETRRATTSAVRDVHVEILRQMHEMREAQTEMFRELRDAQRELAKEVASLRLAQREFVRR